MWVRDLLLRKAMQRRDLRMKKFVGGPETTEMAAVEMPWEEV